MKVLFSLGLRASLPEQAYEVLFFQHSIYQICTGYCSVGLHVFFCVELLATDLKLDSSMRRPHPDIKSHKKMIPGGKHVRIVFLVWSSRPGAR